MCTYHTACALQECVYGCLRVTLVCPAQPHSRTTTIRAFAANTASGNTLSAAFLFVGCCCCFCDRSYSLCNTQGEITRIIPHRATGRADYFGPPVNRAARFLAASAPGQVLAERTLVQECVTAWSADDLVSFLLAVCGASFITSVASHV